MAIEPVRPPRTIQLRTLLIAAGAIVALVIAWFGYQHWASRQRIAHNKTLLESVFRQKRDFVPGEILDQYATGSKVRILSCTPGFDGLQGDCQVMDVDREGDSDAKADKQSWAMLALHENEYRDARGLPVLTGERDNADLAPMLASWKTTAPPAPAPAIATQTTGPVEQAATQAGAGLQPGEYACYGSGQTVLAGIGFKVDASGNYTDLDGKERGTISVNGGQVIFTGGHMDGMKGRDLKGGKAFTIGTMASCDRWG